MLVAGSLKLIDLGIAKSMPGKDTSLEVTSSQGTLDYMSPERIAHGGNPADMSTMTGKKVKTSQTGNMACEKPLVSSEKS